MMRPYRVRALPNNIRFGHTSKTIVRTKMYPRTKQTLRLLLQFPFSNGEIANRIGTKVGTVKSHANRIGHAFKATNREAILATIYRDWIATLTAEKLQEAFKLTPGQAATLLGICQGKGNKVIAYHGGVKTATIKARIENIMDQLDVQPRRRSALIFAVRKRLHPGYSIRVPGIKSFPFRKLPPASIGTICARTPARRSHPQASAQAG